MSLFKRLLNRDDGPGAGEAPCPRCGIPAPVAANECSACGWDLREKYTGAEAGSYLPAPSASDAA